MWSVEEDEIEDLHVKLTSRNLYISTPILKLLVLTLLFLTCSCNPNETTPNLIERPRLFMGLQVPTIGY